MKRLFDEQMDVIYQKFMSMGNAVDTAVLQSVKSFVTHDVDLAKVVIEQDVRVNSSEVAIEKSCFKLIAVEQPMSDDLRRIVAIMKSTSDLERIGDHAVSIAKATIDVKNNERLLDVEMQLGEMAQLVDDMMKRVLVAYVNLDMSEAREIANLDEKVDDCLTTIHQAVVKGIVANPNTAQGGLNYVLVAGYLERIGDYITNICERIIYMETGEIIELN